MFDPDAGPSSKRKKVVNDNHRDVSDHEVSDFLQIVYSEEEASMYGSDELSESSEEEDNAESDCLLRRDARMALDKELLVDLVRNEPRLWDQRIKTYHDRDIKTSLWESIGKELLVKGERARKTWENLRDTFRRKYKGQIENKRRQGTSAPNMWPYFNGMLFLKDIISLKNSSGNSLATTIQVEHSPCLTMESEERENKTELFATTAESSNSFIKPQVQKQTNKRKQTNYDSQALDSEIRKIDPIKRHFHRKRCKYHGDEDYSFLLSLLPTLKQLNRLEKMKLRMKMLKDVTEALEAQQCLLMK